MTAGPHRDLDSLEQEILGVIDRHVGEELSLGAGRDIEGSQVQLHAVERRGERREIRWHVAQAVLECRDVRDNAGFRRTADDPLTHEFELAVRERWLTERHQRSVLRMIGVEVCLVSVDLLPHRSCRKLARPSVCRTKPSSRAAVFGGAPRRAGRRRRPGSAPDPD
jgi:hypothetical protein